MNTYIYPQNLKASARLWLWSLKDFAIIGIAMLISVLSVTRLLFFPPLAVTACYAFITIRVEDQTVLEFITYAVRYFITTQQYFEWGQTKSAHNSHTSFQQKIRLRSAFLDGRN